MKDKIRKILAEQNLSEREEEALKHAVRAIYFDDSSDFASALFSVINCFTQKLDLDVDEIEALSEILEEEPEIQYEERIYVSFVEDNDLEHLKEYYRNQGDS